MKYITSSILAAIIATSGVTAITPSAHAQTNIPHHAHTQHPRFAPRGPFLSPVQRYIQLINSAQSDIHPTSAQKNAWADIVTENLNNTSFDNARKLRRPSLMPNTLNERLAVVAQERTLLAQDMANNFQRDNLITPKLNAYYNLLTLKQRAILDTYINNATPHCPPCHPPHQFAIKKPT